MDYKVSLDQQNQNLDNNINKMWMAISSQQNILLVEILHRNSNNIENINAMHKNHLISAYLVGMLKLQINILSFKLFYDNLILGIDTDLFS